jgi:HD-GYP domain-containing protein (c-di-GMP phosphodiesterase class II)
MLLDKEGRHLVVQSACGLNASIVKNAHVPIGQGIAGKVLQSGRPLLVKDVEKDGLLAAGNHSQYETNSLVSVPLKIEEKAVGVINVNNKVGGGPFNEDDLALVMTLSDKVSTALTEAMKADSSVRRVDKIVDALQALIVMKRSAIPTTTPLAQRLLVLTARRLGLPPAEIRRLQYVASVHDVGMVAVDEEILLKSGPLTEDERDEVGQHPQQGVEMVEPLLQQPEMESIMLAHHERLDGGGYPRGLQGGEIPVGARVLAVIDAFFSMSQRRPYRDGRSTQEAVVELLANAGTQFDAAVVAAFLEVLRSEGMIPGGGAGAAPGGTVEAENRCQPLGS